MVTDYAYSSCLIIGAFSGLRVHDRKQNSTTMADFPRKKHSANLTHSNPYIRIPHESGCGGMADAHGSGPCARKGVEVQVLSAAEITDNPNHKPEVKLIGDGFGFLLWL